ncbi:unnamed protein product [Ixodes hexagonus]
MHHSTDLQRSGSETNTVPARKKKKKIILQCPTKKNSCQERAWASARINYKIAINATPSCHLLHGSATPLLVAALAPSLGADT